ncbi:MAG: hypothetical protein HW376_1222, partial [candidate division NC10 bacterium]|nr:hypothetical protein [candidate division NC10 bacterium]
EVRRNVFDPLGRDWWQEFSVHPEQFIGFAGRSAKLKEA